MNSNEIWTLDEPRSNPIFVTGCPKSGTTLVSQLLRNHPNIELDYDLTVAWYFLEYVRKCQQDSMVIMESFEDGLNLRAKELGAGLHNDQSKYYFANLHSGFSKGLRWGSSSKPVVFFKELLTHWYPGVTFILMLRDPRDVWCSLKNAPWKEQTWRNEIGTFCQTYMKFFKQYNDGSNVKLLRYEDLVHDPIRVYTLLDLNIPDDYLNGIGKVFSHRTLPIRKVDSSDRIVDRRNRWKMELHLEEAKQIETLCAAVFEKGYYE